MCSDECPEATCRAMTTCVAAIAVLPSSRITASAPKAPNCSGPSRRDTTSIWSIAMTWETTSPTPTMAVPWTEIPAAGVPAVAAAGASPAGSVLTGQSSPTPAAGSTSGGACQPVAAAGTDAAHSDPRPAAGSGTVWLACFPP